MFSRASATSRAATAATATTFRKAAQAAFGHRWPTYNVADAVAPSVQKRGIYLRHVGLGATNELTRKYFLEKQISTVDPEGDIKRLFNAPHTFIAPDLAKTVKAAYTDAYKEVHGHPPQANQIEGAWQDFKFTNNGMIGDRKIPYKFFYRRAVETLLATAALEKHGDAKVYFHLGGIDARKYVSSIVLTEFFRNMKIENYIDQMSIPMLIDEDEDARRVGRTSPPGMTNIEIYDSSMGGFKEAGEKFEWVAENGVQLDFGQLQRLQKEAFSAARMLENIELLEETGKMTKEAEAAIANLQQYISTATLSA